MSFFSELKRRRVYRAGAWYAATAFVVLQVADLTFPRIGLPEGSVTFVIALAALGFPIALVLAWVFEITPDGIRRTSNVSLTTPSALPADRRNIVVAAAAAVTLAVAISAYFILRRPSSSASALDGNTLAVMPFEIRGSPSVAYLGEGLVDLLSTKLDGAGDLQTVDSRALLSYIGEGGQTSISPERAAEVARHFGARQYLLGSVVEAAGELHVKAAWYDLQEGSDPIAEAVVEGDDARLFTIVDSLASQLIVRRFNRSDAQLANLASITTSSLPALKTYLEGRASYRRGDFTTALDAFTRAVSADSTFALAWFSHAIASAWQGGPSGDSILLASMERADRFANRLPLRESLLVRGELARARGLPGAIDILEEASARYPHDAEVWYYLGEAHAHLGRDAGKDPVEVERAFARAVALNPDFSPYHFHLVWYTVAHRDSASSLQRIEAFTAALRAGGADLSNRPVTLRSLDLFTALKFGDAATRAKARAALDTVPSDVLSAVLEPDMVFGAASDLSTAEQVARTLNDRRDADRRRFIGLREILLERGKLAEAASLLDNGFGVTGARVRAAYRVSRLSGLNRQPAIDRVLTEDRKFGIELLYAGAYAVDRGRADLLRQTIAIARAHERAATQSGDSIARVQAGLVVRSLEAYAVGRHGQPARAAQTLDSVRIQFPAIGEFQRGSGLDVIQWWIGEFLMEAGRPKEAVPYFQSLWTTYNQYLLAQAYDKMGDRAQARTHYTAFLTAWSDADSGLPALESSKQALARLTAR